MLEDGWMDGWMLGFCWGTNIETPAVQELHIQSAKSRKLLQNLPFTSFYTDYNTKPTKLS